MNIGPFEAAPTPTGNFVGKIREIVLFLIICALAFTIVYPSGRQLMLHKDKVLKQIFHNSDNVSLKYTPVRYKGNAHEPSFVKELTLEKFSQALKNHTMDIVDKNQTEKVELLDVKSYENDSVTDAPEYRTFAVMPFMEKNGLELVDKIQVNKNMTFAECTGDCLKIQDLLKDWDSGKPKAAFYILFKKYRIHLLCRALEMVYNYMNKEYKYPVILFHEKDAEKALANGQVQACSKNSLYFQEIEFQVPSFLTKPTAQSEPCPRDIGYRHMCRFQSKEVYTQPIVKGFKYLFRLDDDSEILNPINYDVFQFMEDHKILYGYRVIRSEPFRCGLGLHQATTYFINFSGLRPYFFDEWPEHDIYYTNFEISNTEIWYLQEYQNYIEYLDRLGGMYYKRWGDAPIKSFAVSIFVPQNRTHLFSDIDYKHGSLIAKGYNISTTLSV